MRVRFPFEFESIEQAFENNEKGASGFYPVGVNNLWHGGVHLYSDKPVVSVADGELVAYRLSSGYVKKKSKDKEVELSDSFVLLKHRHVTPKGQLIPFYALYMHLLPWNQYDQSRHTYPQFCYSSVFTVNTREDGKGLNLRSEANRETIVAVIPLEAFVKKLSDAPPSWPAPPDKPEMYRNYRKVEYNGKVGYAWFGESTFSPVCGGIYQLNKQIAKPDPAPASAAGLNVRQSGDSSAAVVTVLPFGVEVHLLNLDEYKAGKNSKGYYQLDPHFHGQNAGWIFAKGKIQEERKVQQPVLDAIVRPEKLVTIKAGDILGYAGKWYGESLVHFEIFTDKVDFLNNPRKDQSARPTFRLKKEVTFREQSFPKPDPNLKIAADSIAVMLTKESQAGAPPYVKSRQISLQPSAALWVKRDDIAAKGAGYEEKDNCYLLSRDILTAYKTIGISGEPDPESKVAVVARKGEYLKFLDQKAGDYRLVRIKLKDGETKACFALRDNLGTYKKPEYWISVAVDEVYADNPEIPRFTADLPQKLQSDTDFECGEVETCKVFDETWYGFPLPGSEKKGWVAARDPHLKLLDPFQWDQFFEILQDPTRDGYCNVKELIARIEEVKGNKQDQLLSTEEIKAAVADPTTAKYLRRLVVNEKTEWSAATDQAMDKWLYLSQRPFSYHPSVVQAKVVSFIKQFQWFDAVENLIDPKSLWFFHPIAFLGHLGKLGTIIQKGARGRVVEEINIRLAGFGGGVPADTFDDLTETKVKNFQRDYMKMNNPTGVVDEKTAKAIDEFGEKYPIDLDEFLSLNCSCGNDCGGFGKGRYKNEYSDNSQKDEGHHKYEYPGIHRSLLWAVRGLDFALANDKVVKARRSKFESGYRCADHKRQTTNHRGKAVDIHYLTNVNGKWERAPGVKEKTCDQIRTICQKKEVLNASIDWDINRPNCFSLESAAIGATSWVHVDTRMFGQTFLHDKFFCKTLDKLNGKPLSEQLKEVQS